VTFARSAKKTQSVVEIWSEMTVAELAACMKKETGISYTTVCVCSFSACSERTFLSFFSETDIVLTVETL